MRTKFNPAHWATYAVKGRVYEVMVSVRGEVVVIGQPDSEDETHNCDANGCGQEHVLWRCGPERAS